MSTPTDRQTRLFRLALRLARSYGGISAWTRPDGTARTTYRRKIRGLEVAWDRDTRMNADKSVTHVSVLTVRVPDAGTVFEARFDGSRADESVFPFEVVQDDAGGWERILEEAEA